ncbi:MAG TPA: translation initiation factor [Opitutaceae bacterium]|nr:translation initiation factor [Opitutaceae bacterium]
MPIADSGTGYAKLMSAEKKTPTDGGRGLAQNPFAGLTAAGLPKASPSAPPLRNPQSEIRNEKNRGRVDIRRETGGRGGKTVTVVDGFVGIGLPEKEQLAKKMRAACGCGGTVKDGAIEIQGDQRETIAKILSDAGFRPVFAGG